jgi:hypothetical protein
MGKSGSATMPATVANRSMSVASENATTETSSSRTGSDPAIRRKLAGPLRTWTLIPACERSPSSGSTGHSAIRPARGMRSVGA